MGINLNAVTVQDCIEMCDRKGFMAILGNGRLLGFKAEMKGRSPASGRRPEQGKMAGQLTMIPL